MKEIKSITEYQELGKERPAILEFGMAEGCIPCKLTKENLINLEKNDTFNADYYFCSNIDMMAEFGYSNVPVVVVISKSRKNELTDNSISMDMEELSEWLKSQIDE